MKLGLIGLGKQGQRYLMEKNGGRHIVRSGSRDLDDWEGLDGVIIATHPAGHRALALKAIERGLRVLVEKPLALTERDCMDIVDAAEKKSLSLLVAHIDVWAGQHLLSLPGSNCFVTIRYKEHTRDYSPWLDWAPHGLALLERVDCLQSHSVSLAQGEKNSIRMHTGAGVPIYERLPHLDDKATPMWLMVRDLLHDRTNYVGTRRIYRALFSEEHGQGK